MSDLALYVIVGEVWTLMIIQLSSSASVRASYHRYSLVECCVVASMMTLTWPLAMAIFAAQLIRGRT